MKPTRTMVTDRVVVEARNERLATIARFVSEWARRAGFSEDNIRDLELATEELCSNITQHGYPPETLGVIEIQCRDEGDKGSIYIIDGAPLFDPCSWSPDQPSSDISEATPGGRGLAMVHRVVDSIEHERNPGGGNRVRIVKKKSG